MSSAPAPQPPAEREAPASREAREAPLRRGIDGVCSRSSCECEREGLGPACIWLKPTDAELLRRTGEPHIDGWPLMSGLPRPREAREALEPVAQERWVVVCESALDVGRGDSVRTGGRPELGYALLADAATFDSADEASAAIRTAGLPLGWVRMPLSQLLPDVGAALTAARQEGREEAAKDAARYRWLRGHQHISDDGDGWLYLSFDCRGGYKHLTEEQRGQFLDAAIDAARGGQQ